MEPKLQQNLLVLFAVGLLFWTSLATLLPTLPLYAEFLGGNEQQIGLVMGAFAIGLLLSRSHLGRWADQRGRKLVLVIGIAVVAIAPLGYLLMDLIIEKLIPVQIQIPPIPTLIAIRVFHGISIAAFTTAYSALVVDFSPDHQRGEIIGYMSLVNPMGVAIGPALGGYVQADMGYVALFTLSAGLGGLGCYCASLVRESSLAQEKSSQTADSQPDRSWQLLLSPRLRIPTLVMLLTGTTFGAVSTFIPLFIKSNHLNLNPGLFYTMAAIASFGIRVIVGPASDRYGRGLFISISLVFYLLAMLTLWRATDVLHFLGAGLLEGTGAGMLIPTISALMADRSHPHERGRIFGLCIGGFDLGIAIAGPFLGSFAGYLGYRNIFGIAALLPFVAMVLFFTRSSKTLQQSLGYALGQNQDIYALQKPGV